MGYIENTLIAGENVIYKTRLHWSVLFWPIVFAILLGLPGLALIIGSIGSSGGTTGSSQGMSVAGLVLLALAGALVACGVLERRATEMAVTNKRVLVKVGIIGRRTLELFLPKVESIGVNEPLFGRMLGYGTVVVRGIGGTPEPFDRIAHPLEFRRQVQQQTEKVGQS